LPLGKNKGEKQELFHFPTRRGKDECDGKEKALFSRGKGGKRFRKTGSDLFVSGKKKQGRSFPPSIETSLKKKKSSPRTKEKACVARKRTNVEQLLQKKKGGVCTLFTKTDRGKKRETQHYCVGEKGRAYRRDTKNGEFSPERGEKLLPTFRRKKKRKLLLNPIIGRKNYLQ